MELLTALNFLAELYASGQITSDEMLVLVKLLAKEVSDSG